MEEESTTYFVRLAYAGTAYNGWQRQPNGLGVQQVLEEKLELILRQPLAITGCGRTDTGVHASNYFGHFSTPVALPPNLLRRWNSLLPSDIAVQQIYRVPSGAHARFDASRRGYSYFINTIKNPFRHRLEWHYPLIAAMDFDQLQQAAGVLLSYRDFSTFCKSHHDAKTPICQLYMSAWRPSGDGYVYHLEADRFLRGMVRMIVGMCLQVAGGKISLEEVKLAMETKTPLQRAWSVPADGLYLDVVQYPPHYLQEPLY